MRVILRNGVLALAAENDDDRVTVAALAADGAGHVFALRASAKGLAFHDLGPRADACREPIDVSSKSNDLDARWISNFAPTPFELDGVRYACVEAFWQALKFDDAAERARVASLDGPSAKRASRAAPHRETITYRDRTIPFGRAEHWALMEAACIAKFAQHARARTALLATGSRPLVHRVRRESTSIPSAIVTAIWMRVREHLRKT